MGIFKLVSSLFSTSRTSVARASVKGPKRTFGTFPKRANPLSKRSLGNTSRYRRF